MMYNKLFLVLYITTSLYLASFAKLTPHSEEWDYLVLSQFWPATSCYIYFGKSKCEIHQGVNGFTIHGLWPSKTGSHPPSPSYCNTSVKFNYEEIKSLGPQLDIKWPLFDKTEDKTALWSHEWTKHGTCALDLPVLSGEMNFFKNTLNLYSQVNFTQALAKRRIVPSTTGYDPNNFFNAILAEYKVKPVISCTKHKDKYYIEEIMICYNKNLVMQDCAEVDILTPPRANFRFYEGAHYLGNSINRGYFSNCPTSDTILYLPYKPTSTRQEERTLFFNSETLKVAASSKIRNFPRNPGP